MNQKAIARAETQTTKNLYLKTLQYLLPSLSSAYTTPISFTNTRGRLRYTSQTSLITKPDNASPCPWGCLLSSAFIPTNQMKHFAESRLFQFRFIFYICINIFCILIAFRQRVYLVKQLFAGIFLGIPHLKQACKAAIHAPLVASGCLCDCVR